MLDLAHLFKTLLAIARENDIFLVAQDAVPCLKSVLDQMRGLEKVIEDYSLTVVKLNSEEGNQELRQQYEQKIVVFTELLDNRPLWDSIMNNLLLEAQCFWFCGPVDIVSPSTDCREAIENWRKYNEHREKIPHKVKEQIEKFKSSCMSIIREHFPDLLADVVEQDQIELSAQQSLPFTDMKNSFAIPIAFRRDYDATNNSFFLVSNSPLTHFTIPDPKFAKLLGYSVARMLTAPFLSFIVNSGESNEVVSRYNVVVSSPLTAQIYYRSVTRSVKAVRWEVCSRSIGEHILSRGIDVTEVMEVCRGNHAQGTEKLLRNWLHSIRNASFQQQAEVIQDEVNEIKKKIGKDSAFLTENFENLTNSIKTLIYTSRASVGLIDQALSCQDMINSTEVVAFVSAISTFAANFAKGEGIGSLVDSFKLFIDGEPMEKTSLLEGLVVRGDMSTLTTLINNIYSNAVRYTDPVKGVSAHLHIHLHAKSVQFMMTIQDCGEGLPDHVIRFYQDKISSQKIIDMRENTPCKEEVKSQAPRSPTICNGSSTDNIIKPSVARSADRSSLTGIPHIVDIYHELTGPGVNDFDMAVEVASTGTKYTLSFAYDIIVPARVPQNCTVEKELILSRSGRVVLIADDSHVVRRILERYLKILKVPYQSFSDGSYAYEWYMTNYSVCMGVITDLEMPQMGGLTLINLIQQMTPDAPCYIISGNNIAVENVPSNVLGALVKPVTMDELRKVVALLIEADSMKKREGEGNEDCSGSLNNVEETSMPKRKRPFEP